jgi:hypothetical protein
VAARGKRRCVYCLGSRRSPLSKEHVVSAAVVKVLFGSPLRSLSYSPHLRTGFVLDHEHVVRDVCQACNSNLSGYDSAGARLAKLLVPRDDAEGLVLRFDTETLGWLLKTHLNVMRTIRDKETGATYDVERTFYEALIAKSGVPDHLYRLYIEGWAGTSEFWNPEEPRHLPLLSYRTGRFRAEAVQFSTVRFKHLETLVLTPYMSGYESFDMRCRQALAGLAATHTFRWQPVDVGVALAIGVLPVRNIAATEDLRASIRRIDL